MTALSEAQHFLSPVLDRTQLLTHRNLPLLDRLALTLPPSPTPSPTPSPAQTLAHKVLTHALRLLHTISTTPTPTAAPATTALENATDNRTLNALLDLLVLEGIYPSLSPGIGIPLSRRARNFVIPASRGRITEVEDRRDVQLLGSVVEGLLEALGSGGAAARSMRERCLVDVLAGCGELAFGPGDGGEGEREVWRGRWWGVVESTQTPALLPPLLSLLHPSTPPPLRTALTKALSNLPMTRPHAVRHILELFLTNPSLDALANASRLIGAVPAAVMAQQYFEKVCPQLLELLDVADRTLAGAAAYVLAELLGRKGAVEAVVEKEVVAKIVAGMVPETETEKVAAAAAVAEKSGNTASSALLAFEDTPSPAKPRFSLIEEIPDDTSTTTTTEDTSNKALIPEHTLSQTLTRLSTLLTAHPTPSVPHRLLTPLLPALWALTIFALTTSRSTWHTRALSLLHTHIKTSTSPSAVLAALHDHILTAGGATWRFGPGADGGVEVRAGASEVRVDEVEVRVGAFVEVLSQAPEDAIAEFFLGVLRAWLADVGAAVEGVEAAMGMVARTAVLREVVGRFGGALARSPGQTLQIVGGVLGEYRAWKEASVGKGAEEVKPSLEGLGRIVGDRPVPVRRERVTSERRFVGEEEDEDSDDEDLDEESSRAQTMTLALSLLSVLVSSPDTKLTPSDERLLQTLHPALTFLTTAPNIPEDISAFALNILSLLTLHTPPTTAPTSLSQQQKETYALALSYLRDPLIPVRAHGLHLLRELILAAAPVVDVQAAMGLLVGMLKDADSYVYLNVVKCLTALADRHSRTVTRMLVDAYVDADEKLSLDERLRIGEALLNTVQRLGGALVGDVAAALAGGMVAVVSRRKTRGKKDQGDAEFGSDEEADEDVEDVDEAAKEKRKQAAEIKAAIVKGWAGTGRTEDVRIRASALSILGVAIETNAPGLGARVLDEALDIALLVLTLEGGVESGILRRAAVVCVGGVLKALVGQGEEGEGEGEVWREEVWRVVRGRVGEVRRVLGYVCGADNDGLVREQAGVVGGNLEAVVERWVVGAGRGGGSGGGIVEVGEGGLGGLRVL
ncbi:uncharacterized protein H6S33_001287 [Morchella sextelata]|uniref:uncharacterized protein n=1 Tax=Morchella sextelata TaxID=1174677 RepID=UPI001D03DE7D|nr:uncharacterized protein H6S33_001287 [Morchella sextelata]KAH0609059.1 hypothetical protein H6S33_001287 [Morchella sextelata]